MNFTARHLAYLFGVLLLISIAANIFFYQQVIAVTSTSEASQTENEIVTSPESTTSEVSAVDTEPVFASTETARMEELTIRATRFVEYAFTITKDSYTTQKRQAKEVMSEELKAILFAADGSDVGTFETTVRDIEVFPSVTGEGCLVRFEQDLLITETGYEETTQELLALTFESIDGRLVVTEMEDLTPEGGI
ncbi:hypothetical protein ACNOIU_15615 (plasmid) [Exiguobacterium mexicanum]|uniref:Lipoprotein n=1 Tax=Exiguobacterium mexicanum TaxID=340146 RepID=A0ABT7MSA8_9BACL|nr:MULTISPECIES: hypothetical protein [Exiguobacterium]MDL5378098.1 hypothetical protein [Exiguobacterium mexicanum]TCI68011.1 hypothetical protein EVJ19_12080 [Exiguobacterium sp. IPCI3]TCI77428.1 hypothetical protein EVJ18_12070 [Exiguobacterium sp. IPCH1]TCI78906.1 hypothetical protein EVJ17_12070 [Exiguobacterium sp. IPBC4]